MIFEQTLTVPVPVDHLWGFMIDARLVGACMPGIENFNEVAEDRYTGRVKINVGPIALRMEGSVAVTERDQSSWTARMSAEGGDRRIPGGVTAHMTLVLTPKTAGETELRVHTNATILGKLGEFGQPIMKKSADRILRQFVQNIVEKIGAPHAVPPISGG